MIISHKTQGLYSLDIFNIDKEFIVNFLNANFNTKIIEKRTTIFEVDFLVTKKEFDCIFYTFEDEIYDSLNSLNSLFGKEKSLFIIEPYKDLKLTLDKIVINIKVINLESADKKTSQHFKKILSQRGFNTFQYGSAKNKPSNTIRLNEDDYSKPTKTITDLIQTREAIDDKLQNYTEVDNNELELLPKNVHISYITYNLEKNMELFRMGGYLRKVAKDYIVLAGKGNKTFSVQRKIYQNGQLLYVTRFFAKKKDATSKTKNSVIYGGFNENELKNNIKKEYEEVLTQSTSFMKKQQEILEAKQREIAELRARLEEERKKSNKKDELAPIKSIALRESSKIYVSDSDNVSIKSSKSTTSNKSSKSTTSNKSS